MAESEPDGELERLLEYIRDARGFDFTGYKRASLTRRIQRRMQTVGVEDYATYVSVLEANPAEFNELFDTILINVTGFRRDREAWDYLAEHVIPAVAARDRLNEPIRVWSAGTASGPEAYTLAVLLAEELGEERFRAAVKIYATDADEEALAAARHARYPTKDLLTAFGPGRVSRFFDEDGASSMFRQDLRRSLTFGRHDLVQDPPISRIDLLVCRNTLMYFTAEIQRHVLANFHFALADDGYLFLGKSEAMVSHRSMFDAVSVKQRVFRKLGTHDDVRPALQSTRDLPATEGEPDWSWLVRAGFEESPIAQVIVDNRGDVTGANRLARSLFGIGREAAGRPLRDLQISYRPIELSSLVDKVLASRQPASVDDVEWTTPGGDQEVLEVLLLPLEYDGIAGVTVAFMQMGPYKMLRQELEQTRRDLENAYEELQSTVEELETTNEELQSTNEELETINEELHSTNEELETMNEELQSTNEELETANAELRERGFTLDELNRYLSSILASLRSGVVVLAPDMVVIAWNRRAEDLWGLREEEVEGSHFLNLDIGLPVDQLRSGIRDCLKGESDGHVHHLAAVNRRGRSFDCAVQIAPLRERDEVFGVILVMDDEKAREHQSDIDEDGAER